MNKYLRLCRFDAPIGIYLLLYPTLWSLFLAADGIPKISTLIIFVLGVILMRSAGCIINDYADKDFDKLVSRTKNRPITSGEISPKSALKLFAILVFLAFLLVLMTNQLTIILSIPALLLAIIYPFTKRWIYLPQLVLGAAFAMSVPMVFAATNNEVPLIAWWIFATTVVWAMIYDTIYAISDREDDLKIGLKSSAILFAKYDKLLIATLQIAMLSLLLKISQAFNLSWFFYTAIIISIFLMTYHQFLIKNNEPKQCLKAFKNNHLIGLILLLGIIFETIII